MSPAILEDIIFNGRGHLASLLGNTPEGYDPEVLPVVSKNKIDDALFSLF